MTVTLTQVVKQFQQDWPHQLAPEAIRAACRDAAYQWRERTLDPVTTMQLLVMFQICTLAVMYAILASSHAGGHNGTHLRALPPLSQR